MSTHRDAAVTSRGFASMPSTSLGRISVVAFLVGIMFAVLISTVLESASLSIGKLNVMGSVVFLAFLAAAVTGALALVKDRERSWAVWLSTGLPAVAVAFEILSMMILGG